MEFLSENLFIIIAVVIFIAFRVISARRKRAASSREDEAATESSPVNDNNEVETSGLMHWEIDKEDEPMPIPPPTYTRKTLEEAALAHKPLTTLDEASAPLSFAHKIVDTVDVSPATDHIEPLPQAPSPAPAELSPTVPSHNLSALDQLPELKRALVFSEILAPPIALR
jgi:hypothetical protein